MTWNYRVVKYKGKYADCEYGIHEAYYKDKGKIEAITNDPIITGESVEDLLSTLELIKKDVKRAPVIEHGTLKEVK